MAEDSNYLQNALSRSVGERWKPQQLCAVCTPILCSTSNATFAHRQTAREIRDAAYDGCHMCSLIHGSFPLVRKEAGQPSSAVRLDGPWEAEFCRDDPETSNTFTIVAYVSGQRSKGYELKFDGSIRSSPDGDGAAQPGARCLSTFADSTGSDRSLQVAKGWLQKCLDHHEGSCSTSSSDHSNCVPTRLIEIGDKALYLRRMDNRDPRLRYLILSYCWGRERKDELNLTQQNEVQLLTGIKSWNLPRTIADAIHVTRELGYHYLWVDRLCVVQDNDDDWRFEAGRMQAYYMMADCCIAALVSEDAHQGVYVKRNPLLMQPLSFRHPRIGELRHVSARLLGYHPEHYPRLYRRPPYVLSERAWVLQERLLAPRTIYFGSLMLYWECLSTRFAEHTQDRDLDLPFATVMWKFGSRGAQSAPGRIERIVASASEKEDLWKPPIDERSLGKFQERWADMIEFYTKCEMTYPEKDRLVAITGMMRSITERTGQHFVHGLIVSHLPTVLPW